MPYHPIAEAVALCVASIGGTVGTIVLAVLLIDYLIEWRNRK